MQEFCFIDNTLGGCTHGYQLCSSSRRLVLYSYETDFVQGLLMKIKEKLFQTYDFRFRYIDGVLSLY